MSKLPKAQREYLRELKSRRTQKCSACGGSGVVNCRTCVPKDGDCGDCPKLRTCPTCHGRGMVEE